MNKQEVYAFLKEKNLDFEITEHPAVYSMEELAQVALPYPGRRTQKICLCATIKSGTTISSR